MQFDIRVAPDGYAWWYVDAISDDGAHGLTIIAFIGSVFSPYYAWSKTRDPFHHCALNVALYGAKPNRWAMTERGRDAIKVTKTQFQIGNSALSWDGDSLFIEVNETTVPIPSPLRGRVRVRPQFLSTTEFMIDDEARHFWRPVAPCAHVEVDFERPDLKWFGYGYSDTNRGDEPLERAFRYWDWSRAEISQHETAILYNTDLWNGGKKSLALRFGSDGRWEEFAPPDVASLPATPIWRIKRRTRAEKTHPVKILKTFEDTPFYSRSMIESDLFGVTFRSMHESFSGERLRLPIVKALLPFRMPRIAR
ncbi:MAG: carotenoid 1,2-hydratase [Pseudomonadota bacterium]